MPGLLVHYKKPDSKFSARAIRGVFVGYSSTGYVFLNPESGKFYESRNVRFNEKLVYGDKFKKDSIEYWPMPKETISVDDWFLNFQPENPMNNTVLSEREGEIVKIRGRPKKRQLETEKDENVNESNKRRVNPIASREPYETRSRTFKDTSFAHLSQSIIESFEFPKIEDESNELRNPEKDELMHCFFASINQNP